MNATFNTMKPHDVTIPEGAHPFKEIVEPPSPAYVSTLGGWEVWKAFIRQEMEAEGITITNVEGLHIFCGYYFPDQITPRKWLAE